MIASEHTLRNSGGPGARVFRFFRVSTRLLPTQTAHTEHATLETLAPANLSSLVVRNIEVYTFALGGSKQNTPTASKKKMTTPFQVDCWQLESTPYVVERRGRSIECFSPGLPFLPHSNPYAGISSRRLTRSEKKKMRGKKKEKLDLWSGTFCGRRRIVGDRPGVCIRGYIPFWPRPVLPP